MFGGNETFEAKFKPADSGFLYRPSAASKVYHVSEREKATLFRYWRYAYGWRGIALLTASIIIALLLISLVRVFILPFSDEVIDTIITCMTLIALACYIWPHLAPWFLVRGREPIGDRLPRKEARVFQAKEMPKWALLWGILVFGYGTGFLSYAILVNGIDWLGLMIFSFNLFGFIWFCRTVMIRFRASVR